MYKINMQLAQANKSLIYVLDPLQEIADASGFEGLTIAETDDGALLLHMKHTDSSLMEAVAYSLIETAGLNEELELEVTREDDGVTISAASWNDSFEESAAKRPLDEDEDDGEMEEEEDGTEDEDEEDDTSDNSTVDEDTDVLVKSKTNKKVGTNKLKILTTQEAQKIVNRLYNLSGGDDMSHFPAFWGELDALCQKFRGETGYQPEDNEAPIGKAIASAIEQHAAGYLELAKKRKKGPKKEWTKGRGGFLTALMRAIAKNGAAIDTAWDNVDIEAMVPLVSKLGQRVIDAMVAQSERIGKEIPEVTEEEEKAAK